MEKLNQIIADNLIYMRKKHKLTQAQFASYFNYSDKTVSKWETGSIIPNIETLLEIADFYKIPIDYLLQEHLSEKDRNSPMNQTINARNKRLIIALLVTLIWCVAIVVYVASIMLYNFGPEPTVNLWWKVFLWAVPASFLTMALFTRMWFKKSKWNLIFISVFIWTILTASFFTFNSNAYFWPLFIVGVPLQVAVVLYLKLK